MSTMIAEVYEAFKEAGVSENNAMAASKAIADKESLASKEDLTQTKAELKEDLAHMKAELKEDIRQLEIKLKDNMNGLIKWLIPLLIAQSGLIVALMQYFEK